MKRITVILLCVSSLAGIATAGTISASDEQQATSKYCEMVSLYEKTGGDSGWPDYQHNFKSQCSKAGN